MPDVVAHGTIHETLKSLQVLQCKDCGCKFKVREFDIDHSCKVRIYHQYKRRFFVPPEKVGYRIFVFCPECRSEFQVAEIPFATE